MKWFVGVLLLLAIALVLESGLLAYSMYVLLGLLLTSRFLARSWTENVHAYRRCNRTTAEIGQLVKVTLTIRNRGWLPVPWLLLEDLLPRRALAPNNRGCGSRESACRSAWCEATASRPWSTV